MYLHHDNTYHALVSRPSPTPTPLPSVTPPRCQCRDAASFRTSAFLAGLPIQPCVITYPGRRFTPTWETIPWATYLFRLLYVARCLPPSTSLPLLSYPP
jgi:hypothetical protein